MDEWCADYFRSQHISVQTGLPVAENCNIMILGDVVTQLYVPESTARYIEKIYNKLSDISELNVEEFLRNVYQTKIKIKFIVTRNAVIAEQLRNQVLSYFKQDRIAIFDVNDCLVNGFMVVDFAKYLAKKNMINKNVAQKIDETWKQYTDGKRKFDDASNEVIALYANGVKGQDLNKITVAAECFVNQGNVEFFGYSRRLFALMKSYMTTLIITKMPLELVDALKSILLFDSALSTILEVKSGKFTGKIEKNLCGQERKMNALKAWFAQNCVDLRNSVGFGDSHHDLAFLTRVNTPVALNPSPELEKIAVKNNWIIHKPVDEIDKFLNKIRKICKTVKIPDN